MYSIHDSQKLVTPALVLFRDLVERNLATMVQVAGDVSRLRPHCKTHKMCEVARLQVDRGISKFKAATFAEAEMLVRAGARDILLAYHLVGRNIQRAVRFVQTFPDVRFIVIADNAGPIELLGRAMTEAGQSIEVMLDLDAGMHRTGIPLGETVLSLYRKIVDTGGLTAGGFHLYDGHLNLLSDKERGVAVGQTMERVFYYRDELLGQGCPVPRLVCGGTGTFPNYARMEDATVEFSPGTCIFHDAGYGRAFPDLDCTPACVLLTRVISVPSDDLVTFDLGYKAIASDPPLENRVQFPGLPDARVKLQNEEHLLVNTSRAREFQPGDERIVIPWHICPTVALHKQASVVSDGRVCERWDIVARDRVLTV